MMNLVMCLIVLLSTEYHLRLIQQKTGVNTDFQSLQTMSSAMTRGKVSLHFLSRFLFVQFTETFMVLDKAAGSFQV